MPLKDDELRRVGYINKAEKVRLLGRVVCVGVLSVFISPLTCICEGKVLKMQEKALEALGTEY